MSKVFKTILIFLVSLILVAAIGLCVFAALSKDNGGDGADTGNGGTVDNGGDKDKDTDKDKDKDPDTSNKTEYKGLFSGNSTNYKLTSDYTLTEADVKATASSSGNVTLKYLCSFDLGGHTLNLGGYKLSVIANSASDAGKVIKFSNGKIANGSLNISIPKGDIEFDKTDIYSTVSYELEAARDTIKISNAKLLGKCTVNSNTRVSVEYSTVSDLTFTGNGILTAGNKADLGTVTIGEAAAGATLNIAPTATVDKVALNARATLDVNGEVSNISVASTAGGASVNLNEGASVATVVVDANGIKIDKDDNASVFQVIVAEGVADNINATGIELTTATAGDIESYLSHTHVLALVSSTEVSCTQNGEIVYKCAGCDATTTKFTPAYGHNYTYSIVSEPTSTSNGVYKYTCGNCNHSYDATISKEDAIFYHMDVAMIERDGNNYTTIRLQYVSDASGEYYLLTRTLLQVNTAESTETVYTAKLACENGLPEIKPTVAGHCKDWKEISLAYSAAATAAQYKVVGGIVKATDHGYEAVNGGRTKVKDLGTINASFAGTCYRNEKTGENSYVSVHDLKATAAYVDASKGCSGGLNVTVTCKNNCGYQKTETSNGHYYLESSKKALITQCNGENDYFQDAECVACHYKNVSYSLDYKYHTLSYSINSASINVSDLANHGFDCNGFYYGTYWVRHCATCGINVYEYYYYTHTAAAGCLYHKAYVADYQGNEDFEGFTYKAERSEEGHRSVYSDHVDYTDLNQAVADVLAVTKEDALLITPAVAFSYDSHCQGCNLKFRDYIVIRDAGDDTGCDQFMLTMNYDDGSMSSWSYRYDYTLATSIDRVKNYYGITLKYGLNLEDATYMWNECYYSKNSSGDVYELINLRKSGNGYDYGYNPNDSGMFELRLYRYNDSMDLTVYYVEHCEEYNYYYQRNESDEWTTAYEPGIRMVHYAGHANGENCREDGKSCIYCGEYLGREHKMYYDDWYFDGHWTDNPLATGGISGLDAAIDYDICYDCHGIIGVTVTLRSNWTLTGDVYIKAEDITFDLNGFTIDLNGHNLVIYSYAGERVVMTDNGYNTASGSSTGSITNGTFVLATNGGDIVVGTISGDADMVLIETADRRGLYDALVAEGYNMPFVRA